MQQLVGKVAWVAGAGSGIGQAAALALAGEGARVVLTGRRAEALAAVAKRIEAAGGEAHVKAGDLRQAVVPDEIAGFIGRTLGRLDIMVNSAGQNLPARHWEQLTPEGIDALIGANLTAAFYCARAALALMRPRRDGVLIHVSSWAGRWVSMLGGPAYSAAKHGMVAMSHSINMEECVNGIRSCVICPGEVATSFLDLRPVPVSAEDRAQMVKAEDCGDLIRYIACLPAHVCINEVVISPTMNRSYLAALKSGPQV